MCRLLTLVTAVSSMIGKPVQPLTTLEVMPNGVLAFDEKDEKSVPSALVQTKKTGFDRGKKNADDVSDEEKAAFDDTVANTESRAIEYEPAFDREVRNPLVNTRNKEEPTSALQQVQFEDQIDASIDKINDGLDGVAKTNANTEAMVEQAEHVEALETKVEAEYARQGENEITKAYTQLGSSVGQLQQATQEQKAILNNDEQATTNIKEGTRAEEDELAELERQVWEKNSDLSSELTVLTTKTNTLSEDITTLYTAGYDKTHIINLLIEQFQEFVQQTNTEDQNGLAIISNVVKIMQDFAQLEAQEKAAEKAAGAA